MKKIYFDSSVGRKSILGSIITIFSIVMFVILYGCYIVLKQETFENVSLNEHQYIVEKDKFFEPTITQVIIPSEIKQDTYLPKGSYKVNGNLTIDSGVTLELDAGSELEISSNGKIYVQGIFRLKGTETENINLNYSVSGLNSSDDTVFINIESNGYFDAVYTNIKNLAVANVNSRHSTPINNKGKLKLDHTKFKGTEYLYPNIYSFGDIEITNSELLKGLYINDVKNILILEDNIVNGEISVSLKNCNISTFENIKNNYNKNNELFSITIYDNPVTDIKLTKQNYYYYNSNIVIPENTVFEIEAGSDLQLSGSNNITVQGVFKLNGTETENINLRYSNAFDVAEKKSFITVEPNGSFESNHSKIINTYQTSDRRTRDAYPFDNKGNLKLNYTEIISDVYLRAYIYTIGNTEITNSNLPSNIYINEVKDKLIIEDNIVNGEFRISLKNCDMTTFERIKNNYRKNQELSLIVLGDTPITNIKLYKQRYKIQEGNFVLPENLVFEIDAGTNIEVTTNGKMDIKGTIKLNGTKEENINLSVYHTLLENKDTAFITIEPTGNFEALYYNMTNIYVYDGYRHYSVPFDNKGNLKLEYTKVIADKSLKPHIYTTGDIEITNSELPDSIYIDGVKDKLIIENNIINTEIRISLKNCDITTFERIKNNYNRKNELNNILLYDNPINNIKLTKQNYRIITDFTIPENTVFEVDAGANIEVGNFIFIEVNGIFSLSGTITENTVLKAIEDGKWRGIRINSTGKLIASNTEIKQAGYEQYAIENKGQLIMWNTSLNNLAQTKAINFNNINQEQILINNSICGQVQSNAVVQAYYNYWCHKDGPKVYDPTIKKDIGGIYTVGDKIAFYPYNTTFIKNDIDNVELLKNLNYTKINDRNHFGELGVNSYSGNYSKQFVDLNNNNENNNLTFERTYNSKSNDISIFSEGWSFSFSSKIEKLSDYSYMVYFPNGSIDIYIMKDDNTYTGIHSRDKFEIINEKYILTKTDQTVYTYNINGILETISDKYENMTQIITNSVGNITSVIDNRGRQYSLEYNTNNQLVKITDPIGREVKYSYNLNNLLETVTNVNGIKSNYVYDENNKLTSIKENNIEIEKMEYTTSTIYGGKISKYTNEFGNQITYTYDQPNSVTIETDSNGNVTKKYYDREGYITKVINPNNTQTLTTYNVIDSINKYGEILTTTDIYTNKTVYTRDNLGRITKITNPDVSNKQYTYNSKNQVVLEKDELGNLTQYIYDTDEISLLKVVKPIDGFTLYDENSDQNLFEITTYTYYSSEQTNGIKGLIKTKTDSTGTTTYEYDQFGNVIKEIDELGNQKKYSNNNLGWKLSEQINDGYVTSFQYNNFGALTNTNKDANIISKTEYNYQNKPSRIVDGNNNSELIEYDKAGNVIKKIDKEGNSTIYEYDLYGNVLKIINSNKSIYLYEYDQLNRLTKKSFKEQESSEPILIEEKSYTNTNNYTITTKTYITTTEFKTKIETYNYQNKLISEKNEDINSRKEYFKNGLLSIEVDGNSGYTHYFYTKTNHLAKKYVMVGSNQYIYTAYVYDSFGKLIEEKLGKTKVTSTTVVPTDFISTYYQYNKIGQVVKKTTSSGEEINYTYDENGNILSEITKIDDDNYQTKEYKYNYLNKVIEETLGDNIINYSYDKVGNVKEKITGENKVTKYEYNKNSKITKTINEGLVQEQIYYDNMSNIIKKTDGNGNFTEYFYDKRNNLIQEKDSKSLSIFNSYDLNDRLIEYKDKNNISTKYTYDKFNNVIEKNIENKQIYKYEYDKNNNLSKEIDPLGYIILYTYDKTNKLTQETDKLNYTKQYQYDTQFNIVSEKNKKNQYTYYTYDERNNKISTTINNVVIEKNEYNLLNNVIKTIDGNSNETNFYYSNNGKLIKKVNPLGYTEEYGYNKDNQLVKIADNLDKQTIYSYDDNGNVIEEIIQKSDGTERINTTKKYDNNNNLIQEIDGNGNYISYQYDSLNNKIKLINSLNQITTYEYDCNNNLISETNYLGDSKTYIYDEFNRLIKTKNELDQTVEILEYDLNNRKIKSTDALGNSIVYVYDKNDNLIETIDQLGYNEKNTYDQIGNIISKIDKNGNITKYEYDMNQNLIKVTNPLNEITKYTYDRNNNLKTVTDARDKITSYTYDALNNQTSEKDGLGNTEYKDYYINGLLKSVSTRNDSSMNYIYDIHGNNVSTTIGEPLFKEEIIKDVYYIKTIQGELYLGITDDINTNGSKVKLTELEDNGKQEWKLEKLDNGNYEIRAYRSNTNKTMNIENSSINNGASVQIWDISNINAQQYKIENNNGLYTIKTLISNFSKCVDISGGNIVLGSNIQQYTCNNTNAQKFYLIPVTIRVPKDINPNENTDNITSYTYDNNRNLIETSSGNNIITRTYDKLNRVVSKTENGLTTTFIYDINGYKEKTIDPLQNETIKEYDKTGKLIKVNDDAEYIYNFDGTLQKLTYASGATEEYFYNADKTLNKLVNTYNDNVEEYTYEYDKNKNILKEVNPTQTIINTYDSLNRLKSVLINDKKTDYTYDKSGNRIKEIIGNITKDYIYDSKNRLIQITEKNNNAINKITTYEYDLNGNLLTTKVNDIIEVTNVFNDKNELVSTEKNNVKTIYDYNPEGLRISKSSGMNLTKFIYEGKDIILEVDENNSEISKNTYGLTLISRSSNNSKGYYLYNGHGNTTKIIDSDNEILNTYEYDVWGNIIDEVKNLDNPFTYAGYYYDIETNNYYLLSRYYNPSLARFISEDTYKGELNDPLSLNRYVYVNNNPMIYYDPNGYFLKESLEWLGKRVVGLVEGTGKLAYDMATGTGKLAYNTGELIGSSIGITGNYGVYKLGLINEKTFNYLHDEYSKTYNVSSQIVKNIPNNIVNGVVSNIQTTFNVDNFINYLTTDNYNEIVDYSKSVVQTGLTGYSGYKVGQTIYNKITSSSTFGIMNKTDATRYNQYWDDVKQGLTAEQRFNIQNYGRIDGIAFNNNPITGYTKHGLESAMGHDGFGIKPSSILDTVKNPIKIGPGSNHTVRYTGTQGVVNLNYSGEIVTAWAKGSKYWRVK